MESLKVLSKSQDDLIQVAETLLNHFPSSRLFAISGPMGAGKTTFIQAACRLLGVSDNVSSPSFSIVNEYKRDTGEAVYHFDLYRLRKPDELFEIGYEDYFYSDHFCFIEWPEMAKDLIPAHAIYLSIEEGDEGTRIFTAK